MAPGTKAPTGRPVRTLGLSDTQSPFRVVETAVAAGTARAAPADPGDPTGVKGYIAFSVAHGIYPQGAGIDPDEDISDDVALNSATISAEINFDAQHLATIHQLTWSQVSPADVQKLGTVGDLVALVKQNLA